MTLRDRIMRSLDHAHACEKMTSLPETSHTRPSEFLIQKGPGDEANNGRLLSGVKGHQVLSKELK